MKYLRFGLVILALCLFSCNQDNEHKESRVKESAVKINTSQTIKSSGTSKDKQEIQALIRKVLNWADSKNSIDLLPALTDNKDSIVVGFDLEKLKANLEILKATNFFSSGFIENYNQIILALNSGIRNHKYDKWPAGELPTFSFANDVDPWCDCQDNFSWSLVEVKAINLNSENGELCWTWGKSELDKSVDSWKDFAYKFNVVKENDRWKISYMQGFDFKESIRKDGI
jgi:hypothetical protein